MTGWENFMSFEHRVMIPIALVGILVAIVLLVLRRKKNGVRPQHAKGFLTVALFLIVYAIVALILLPLTDFVIHLAVFGAEFMFAAMKSL